MNVVHFKLFTFFLLVLFGFSFFPPQTYGESRKYLSKPQSPFKISITREDKNEELSVNFPADIVTLKITTTSYIEATDLHIDIKVPNKIEVIAGELKWKGPLKKNSSKVLTIQLRLGDIEQSKVEVSVVLPSNKGPALSMVSKFELSKNTKIIMKSPNVNSNIRRGIIERIIKK